MDLRKVLICKVISDTSTAVSKVFIRVVVLKHYASSQRKHLWRSFVFNSFPENFGKRFRKNDSFSECMNIQVTIFRIEQTSPVGIYLLKVNNRNTRARCEICSIRHSGVFIVNFEHISYLVLVFLLLTLSRQMPAG